MLFEHCLGKSEHDEALLDLRLGVAPVVVEQDGPMDGILLRHGGVGQVGGIVHAQQQLRRRVDSQPEGAVSPTDKGILLAHGALGPFVGQAPAEEVVACPKTA